LLALIWILRIAAQNHISEDPIYPAFLGDIGIDGVLLGFAGNMEA
jgi:hypothetical protein